MSAIPIVEHDTELMQRIQTGDDAGFALLLDRYRLPVIQYLYRMVQNQADAEELAQEVFLHVYRARQRYRPTARFSTWLFRIATNRAINWRRDLRREGFSHSLTESDPDRAAFEIPDGRPTIEQRLIDRTGVQRLRRAVQSLPARQRGAVILHKYHEMEYSQIARTLGCSESAVKSLLFRAYEQLRARLAGKC